MFVNTQSLSFDFYFVRKKTNPNQLVFVVTNKNAPPNLEAINALFQKLSQFQRLSQNHLLKSINNQV